MRFAMSLLILVFTWSSLAKAEQEAAVAICDCDTNVTSQVDLESYLKSSVKSLPDAKVALFAKLLAIRQAKHTIDISYYIFRTDTSGLLILNAIKEALERGVKVRVLIDDVGSFGSDHDIFKSLFLVAKDSDQLSFSYVNPVTEPTSVGKKIYKQFDDILHGRFRTNMNNRMHDKILLIDGNFADGIAFMGGRNIGDEYSGVQEDSGSEPGDVFDDYEVMLRNDKNQSHGIIQTIHSYYENFYQRSTHIGIRFQEIKGEHKYYEQFLKRITESTRAYTDSDMLTQTLNQLSHADFLGSGFERVQAKMVSEYHNIVGPQTVLQRLTKGKVTGVSSLKDSTRSEMQKATRKIEIISPYLVFTEEDMKFFLQWLDKNPTGTIDFYSASINSNDSFLVQSYFDTRIAPAIQAFARKPEYAGRMHVYSYDNPNKNKLHMKMIALDEEKVLVTSSNFDHRSQNLNSEVGMWVEGQDFYQEAKQKGINTVKQNSYEFGSVAWSKARRNMVLYSPAKSFKYIFSNSVIDKFEYFILNGL